MKRLSITALLILLGGCGQDTANSNKDASTTGASGASGSSSELDGQASGQASRAQDGADGSLDNAGATSAGGDYDECDETLTELGLEERTADGLAAEDVIGFVEGKKERTLVWSEGAPAEVAGKTTAITLELELSSKARLIEREGEPGTVAAYLYCHDSLELDVTATIRTEDGALDERAPGVLTVVSSERADLSVWCMHDTPVTTRTRTSARPTKTVMWKMP